MTEVRLALDSDSPLYWQHLMRHTAESGKNGDLSFTPDEGLQTQTLEELYREKSVKWWTPLNEPHWERCWIVVDTTGVFGSLRLTHSLGLKSTLHRATLVMGVEQSHRNQGWGKRLVAEAISWASQQRTLEWIDLYVFAHNQPALKLYSKAGFTKAGQIIDQFRIHNQKIDDLHLTLNLRS